ncbi:conserved hypothetical protein [Theileria equi strain WA]|uniref:Uncharacterized protein n=1 Tax=Theileria equi strain WA TaxID=1537102 RepID=L1LFZ9_THEEQ|nr:conserved hypothetical protein [Theileria equi strain WA]EKX74199.1 conserved hypothetical protein [Theileria equi strain WA]|eukprot:XP_004833651.1 conserved hypothetical protein [Theileria equi strain WA]
MYFNVGYVLYIVLVTPVFCRRFSFLNTSALKGQGFDRSHLPEAKLRRLGRITPCNAAKRTGVCVPEDVALFGNTVISYECLYTKDGRTQTGDEWETEMTQDALRAERVKKKKPKKVKRLGMFDDEPDSGFKKITLPPPYNTTEMLLREGTPYLTISSWIPGLNVDDIKVIVDYSGKLVNTESYTDEVVKEIPNSPQVLEYYQTSEEVPPPFEQHKYSYNSTYNDLFNRMAGPDYEFTEIAPEGKKPPLIFINVPKNTLVKQWERATFRSRRDPKERQKYSRIQRAYRPFAHIDLRTPSCVYKEGTLQLVFKLTHIPPPPDAYNVYNLPVLQDGEIKEFRTLNLGAVHGWMYNWHHFRKYDLSFDLSKMYIETENIEVPPPDFVFDMTPKQVRQFMRDADAAEKKALK